MTLLNNKNQGRGNPLPGIAPPIASRDQLRDEFLEAIRQARVLFRRGTCDPRCVEEVIAKLIETYGQSVAICHAIGYREGKVK